jgi:hypothetical protein
VDATGRLVAEGLEGPPGEKGDSFTYEDFTPEQLEDLQGPPGPSGPDDLKPYGPENSYLIIQNGKPTWISGGPDPEPPGPIDPVMLYDNRDQPDTGVNGFGMHSDDGSFFEPTTTWDAYARTQDFFTTPIAGVAGLGGSGKGGGSWSMSATFNIEDAIDKVLQIDIAVGMRTTKPGDITGQTLIQVLNDSDQLQTITDSTQISIGAGDEWKVHSFTWFPSRPTPGLVKFTVNGSPVYGGTNNTFLGAYFQRWTLVDPAAWFLQRYLRKEIDTTDLLPSPLPPNS